MIVLLNFLGLLQMAREATKVKAIIGLCMIKRKICLAMEQVSYDDQHVSRHEQNYPRLHHLQMVFSRQIQSIVVRAVKQKHLPRLTMTKSQQPWFQRQQQQIRIHKRIIMTIHLPRRLLGLHHQQRQQPQLLVIRLV